MSQPIRLASAFGAPGAPSALTRWADARLDEAAEFFAALGERFGRRRRLELIEQPDGSFLGPIGSLSLEEGKLKFANPATARRLRGVDLNLRLSPQRCVLRELELPARARDFLEGVVRAQIDRLTPWRPEEAAFGWSEPQPLGADRILVTVAATKRAPIAGLLELGADAVAVTASREGAAPITLLSRRIGASARRRRWRFTLLVALGLSAVAGAAALAADWTIGADLRSETDTLTDALGERRAAIARAEHAGEDPAAVALDARKRALPAAVVVLEALSRAIPDDAYLTELRLTNDKVEISGLAVDAAALVRHIEQSPHFSHAAFTAPTTRRADERESFRIEAHVAPLNTVSP